MLAIEDCKGIVLKDDIIFFVTYLAEVYSREGVSKSSQNSLGETILMVNHSITGVDNK